MSGKAGAAGGGGAAEMQFPAERPEQQEDIRNYRDEITAINGRLQEIISNADLKADEKARQINALMESSNALQETCRRIVLANIDDRLRMNLLQSVEQLDTKLEAELQKRAKEPLPAPAALLSRPGTFTSDEQQRFATAAAVVHRFDTTRVIEYSRLSSEQKDQINAFIMTDLMETLRVRLLSKIRSLPKRPDPVAEKEFDDFMKLHFQTILRAAPALLAQFFGVNERDELIIPRKPEVRGMVCNTVIDDMIFKARVMGDSVTMIAESLRPRDVATAVGGVMGMLIASSNYPVLASLLGNAQTGISFLLEGAAYSMSNYPLATVSSGVLLVVEHEYIYELWSMIRAQNGEEQLPFAEAQRDPVYIQLFLDAHRRQERSRMASFVGEPPAQLDGLLDLLGAARMFWWKTKSAVCRSVVGGIETVRAVASAPGHALDFCSKAMDATRSFLQTKANKAIASRSEANQTQVHSCRLIFSNMADDLNLQDVPEVQQTLLNLGKYDQKVILTHERVEAATARLLIQFGPSHTSPSPERQAYWDPTSDSLGDRADFMMNAHDPYASGAYIPGERGFDEVGGPDSGRAAKAGTFDEEVLPFNAPPSNADDSSRKASKRSKLDKGGKRATRRKASTKKQQSKKNKRQSRRNVRRSSSRKSRK